MDNLYIKVADCSYEKLVRTADTCGFIIFQGKKHCKVKTKEGSFITTIPRHSRLKRETAKGIVEQFNKFGGNIVIM